MHSLAPSDLLLWVFSAKIHTWRWPQEPFVKDKQLSPKATSTLEDYGWRSIQHLLMQALLQQTDIMIDFSKGPCQVPYLIRRWIQSDWKQEWYSRHNNTTPLEMLQIIGQSTRGRIGHLAMYFLYTRVNGKGVARGVIQAGLRNYG